MTYTPPFVDEFAGELGKVTDCVPASGLMGVNKRTYGAYPVTPAEREALQAAMGTTNLGANAAQLAAGIKKRYGLTIAYGSSWTIISAALRDPKRGVAILGSYTALPAALRSHGRQPTFSGLHCVYAQALDPVAGTTTIGDPLATSYYNGLTIDQLKAYCAGLNFMYALFVEDIVTVISLDPIPVTGWQTKVGDLFGYKLGVAPRKTTWTKVSGASCDAIVSKVEPLPVGWPAGPFLHVTNGTYAGYMVPQASVTFTPPDPCAAVKTELATAKSDLSQTKAALAAASTKISAAKNALA